MYGMSMRPVLKSWEDFKQYWAWKSAAGDDSSDDNADDSRPPARQQLQGSESRSRCSRYPPVPTDHEFVFIRSASATPFILRALK